MLSAHGLCCINFSLPLSLSLPTGLVRPNPSPSLSLPSIRLRLTKLLSLSLSLPASVSSTLPQVCVAGRTPPPPSVPESPGADVQFPVTHEVAVVAEPAPCPNAADATGRAPHLLLCVWKMGSPVPGPPARPATHEVVESGFPEIPNSTVCCRWTMFCPGLHPRLLLRKTKPRRGVPLQQRHCHGLPVTPGR